MKYLLLICAEEAAGAAHASDGCGGWDEEMTRRGALLSASGLRPPAEGVTVEVRDGQVLRTDGPFAETKEQIGGFCVIECGGPEEAAGIAAAHPAAAYGSITVRELWPQ